MRRFAEVELSFDKFPDETTILRFRHLLEQHRLTQRIFEAGKDLLDSRRLFLHSGTIVDATIVAALCSAKNEAKARDPEMQQTKKGKNWHSGMKFQIGTDRRGTVHSLSTTHAAVSDLHEHPKRLHGEESVLYGDQAYWRHAEREAFDAAGIAKHGDRRKDDPRVVHQDASQIAKPMNCWPVVQSHTRVDLRATRLLAKRPHRYVRERKTPAWRSINNTMGAGGWLFSDG